MLPTRPLFPTQGFSEALDSFLYAIGRGRANIEDSSRRSDSTTVSTRIGFIGQIALVQFVVECLKTDTEFFCGGRFIA